jgi:hypothetical protein
MLVVVGSSQTFAQIEWQRYVLNPVLDVGSPGSWDDNWVRDGRIIFDGDLYHCWYTAVDGEVVIGYASSPDGFNWTKHPNPVLGLGPAGSFDHGAVLAASVIKDGDTFKMWYQGWASGFHENRIGYATSADGIKWTKADSVNPVMSPGTPGTWNSVGVFFPSVIFDGVIYHMWYAGADANDIFRIGYATSSDGIVWNEHPDNPILNAGSAGSWEEDVKDHIVVFDGTIFHMWYTGAYVYPYYRIGYATSPDGINWTKADDVNPVLDLVTIDWEKDGLETGGVLFDGITYEMWYSGCDGDQWRIGYARSSLVVDNVNLNSSYAAPGTDGVLITTKMKDPNGITLFAEIQAPDQILVDSLQLFDDGNHNDGDAGDSLYANLWPVMPIEESNYFVNLEVTRVDTDTIVNHLNRMAVFTTIGPIVYSSYVITSTDTIPNPGEIRKFLFFLTNVGSTATAKNITTKIIPLDTCASLRTTDIANYGDIAPGETIMGDKSQYIQFSDNCADGYQTQFVMEIFSNGYHFWSDTFKIDVFSGIEDEKQLIVKEFKLHQNHPNPFNPSTIIEFSLPKSELVELKVYNILGSQISTLVSKKLNQGNHTYTFDGKNLASGVYYYQLIAGEYREVKKMILLR